MASTSGLPYVLADKTGLNACTDYDEIYDRMFLRTMSTSSSPSSSRSSSSSSAYGQSPIGSDSHSTYSPNGSQTLVYELTRRSTRASRAHPDVYSDGADPSIVLEFGPQGALGSVMFVRAAKSIPMTQWIRKTSVFGKSVSRKFRASDGREYKWEYRPSNMQKYEWTCTSEDNFLVAHYALKPDGQPSYRNSGNTLTIYEAFTQLALELLASLTVMRHIQQYNL